MKTRLEQQAIPTTLVTLTFLFFFWAGSARAELAIKPGSFKVTTSSSQAGAHADWTTSFAFLTNGELSPEGDLRNVAVDLPAGFAGTPIAAPTCTQAQLGESHGNTLLCPPETQVGVTTVLLNNGSENASATEPEEATLPVYNMVPAPGQTADLGFTLAGVIEGNVAITVRPGEYGLRATDTDVYGGSEVDGDTLTVWGVPASPNHDAQRGQVCERTGPFVKLYDEYHEEFPEFFPNGELHCEGGGSAAGVTPAPFLDNPTQCTGSPTQATLEVNSWRNPAFVREATEVAPFTGCEHLGFDPGLSVAPTVTQASSPTGYNVAVKLPQNNFPEGLVTADLSKAVVTLPAGVVLSPSAANGLLACQETGPEGINMTGPESEEADLYGNKHAAKGKCPNASELGTMKIFTPAFGESNPLNGHVYLAQPLCGGSGQPTCTSEDAENGTLYGIYLEAEGPGVIIKLKGRVSVNSRTGQVTTTFDENPQLPFNELLLEFFGGPRAPLANPRACGPARTEALFSSYAAALSEEPFGTFSEYTVTGCQPARFAPSFIAGTNSNQAGGYSPLSIAFSREDADQFLGGVTMQMPPGLLGTLANVPLCEESQAAQGTCSSASQIGETTVTAGPGPDPDAVTGGKVYLTTGYGGGQFGLSVVVPAVAGPFNLGTVVVRAAIHVNPLTAALTVVTEPLPTMLEGIPIQLKAVGVTINRPDFTLNPTDCAPLSIAGTLSSSEGMSAPVSSHFQAANCASLAFKPSFAVSTQGKTSKADGASLTAKLTFPTGPLGSEANIAKVKVDLPKQLPSRLTTLQKACTAAQFEADPAGCPAASIVGHARAVTPILPVPLEGSAYFVSHGGEAFPSLIVVLQGYGVTVDLVGTTFISKTGITSSTFKAVPDVPVSVFELNLPEGPYSALAANGNLCTSKLTMPTAFVAQNGAEIHESTKISVTGCAKPKALTRAQKLKTALAACRKKAKRDRTACDVKVRERYGMVGKNRKR
jgi:hypothetical protein